VTKYYNGHSDVVMGLTITRDPAGLGKRLRFLQYGRLARCPLLLTSAGLHDKRKCAASPIAMSVCHTSRCSTIVSLGQHCLCGRGWIHGIMTCSMQSDPLLDAADLTTDRSCSSPRE